ncbi:GyrI-like domain-containing protein [Geodermatophilus sp. YIM 151500]|uniref:GyrI-like domain-containing protein n=1 Tax=Geodermatophilus sp. YIM 151500 TaxID=2984531 RepID=UPI0021E367AD|nr:GyrI-like domain-containing protein [Geodermatophilus sp. YIM 151500]MCV2488231.1 GyrI-like domain-containing protein [Geodermatophilus sp. YIM 151500]
MSGTDVEQPGVVTVAAVPTAVVRGEVPADELPEFFDRAFQRLPRALAAQGVRPTSAAFGLYHRAPSATVELEVGFVVERAVGPDGDVVPGSLPGGRVARLVHVGGFDGLGASWDRLATWVQEQGLTPGEVFWEVYLTRPSPDMDPATLRTELNMPLSG